MNLEKVRRAINELVNLPCGGIGLSGATMDELITAEKNGHSIENDSTYHSTQKAWLFLNAFIEENK